MIMKRKGYALPMTLAAIIVLSLIASIAANEVRRSNQAVANLADRASVSAQLASAEQTLIFSLLTETMGPFGLRSGISGVAQAFGATAQADSAITELVLANGSPYQVPGTEVFVRLYAPEALFSFATTSDGALKRILDSFDVPPINQDRLIAKLADFQDEDDRVNLGGAERSSYPSQSPPPNRALRHESELCAVLDWAQTPVCEDLGRLALLSTVAQQDQLNVRLLSEQTLGFLLADPFLLEDTTRDVYNRIVSGEVRQFREIGLEAFDERFDPLLGGSTPGPRLIIVAHDRNGRFVRRSDLELTLGSATSPFFVHSKYAIGGDYVERALRIETNENVIPLPPPSSINSAR